MNLLIDIGNSNFKWCFSNGEEINNIQSFQYTQESIISLLNTKLLNEINLTELDSIYTCCVAGANIKSVFSDWVNTTLLKPLIFFESSNQEFAVKNAYSNASDLGNDRWLSLVFAHHLYQSDVCIIDCGTAITIDVVLKSGQHEGGLIAPGYLSQIKALELKTNITNNQKFVNQKNSRLLQNNTYQCIEQGCRVMSLGFIKDMVKQLKHQYSDTLKVVITGGDSESLASELPAEWYYNEDLLFRALLFFSAQSKNELN
ncbi:MAG: type III pantothenate kinase [Thiohalomonadales bacterium]